MSTTREQPAVCPACMGVGKLWCAMCGTWGDHRSGGCAELREGLRLGAAAVEGDKALLLNAERSLQRVGRLAARWRDAARLVETLADHTAATEAAKMTASAEQMRCCADALEAEMAGSGPTV